MSPGDGLLEKLIYLLGQPGNQTVDALDQTLRAETVAQLRGAGASYIRACIRDYHVQPAAKRCQGKLPGQIWCYLTLWVASRTQHRVLRDILAPLAAFLHAYTAAESEQLSHGYALDGSRVEGMNQVVCFRRPAAQERGEWLDTWLNSHSQIAIDTQSSFGYIQHIVGDTLEPESPHFDAFVEENFPAAAMASDEAFYDATGDELQRRMEGMINSVLRFIDMESLQVMPMSEYNF